jgi:heme oxygenase
MFTDKIKEATLQNHQQVEKVLVSKMKGMRSVNDYVNLLRLFYGYFSGLEQQIKPYINAATLPDHDDRRKTAAIANDLATLSGTLPDVATGEALPAISNELEALGALYVIEGSTLGGKIISQMIQQHLNITDDGGLSFFNGYGDNTQPMWDTFKASLNTAVKTQDDEVVVVNAANETFSKFKQWIEVSATVSS